MKNFYKARVYGKNPRWFYFASFGAEEDPTVVCFKDTVPTIGMAIDKFIEDGKLCTLDELSQIAEGIKNVCGTEVSDEELLAASKSLMVAKIKAYDVSDAVNSFSYGGMSLWFSQSERNGVVGRLNAEKVAGKENTTLWAGTIPVTLPVDTALGLFIQLELYASECYDVTASHVAAVMAATTMDELAAIDITADYPANPSW